MSILQTLRDALPKLPKKLALAARYALDHPDQMALNSMRSNAASVGVTSTTMLRLARQLGFEGYEDFKSGFQNELIRDGFGARADALHQKRSNDGQQAVGETILLAAETNIREARKTLKQSDLDSLADLMRLAPNVYLIGSGSLFWLASMMRNTGNMVLPNLRLIGAEYSVASEAMGILNSDDVVICFGMNPIAQRTVDAIRFAEKSGAYSVAITDRPSSPLADGARFAFFSDTASPHYYPSPAPLMVMVEAILATVMAKGGDRELSRIQEFETMRKDSGRYIES